MLLTFFSLQWRDVQKALGVRGAVGGLGLSQGLTQGWSGWL